MMFLFYEYKKSSVSNFQMNLQSQRGLQLIQPTKPVTPKMLCNWLLIKTKRHAIKQELCALNYCYKKFASTRMLPDFLLPLVNL